MSDEMRDDELARRAAYLARREQVQPGYERHQEKLASGWTVQEILLDEREADETADEPEYLDGEHPHWSGFDTREEYEGLR